MKIHVYVIDKFEFNVMYGDYLFKCWFCDDVWVISRIYMFSEPVIVLQAVSRIDCINAIKRCIHVVFSCCDLFVFDCSYYLSYT